MKGGEAPEAAAEEAIPGAAVELTAAEQAAAEQAAARTRSLQTGVKVKHSLHLAHTSPPAHRTSYTPRLLHPLTSYTPLPPTPPHLLHPLTSFTPLPPTPPYQAEATFQQAVAHDCVNLPRSLTAEQRQARLQP